MPQRGRKPKPAETREIEGNPGHRPIPDHPNSPATIHPPEQMTREGLKIWSAEAEKLYNSGILTELNAMQFAVYCESLAHFWELVAAGKNDKAFRMQNQIRIHGSEFGLTPSSSLRVAFDKKESDSADGMLKLLRQG